MLQRGGFRFWGAWFGGLALGSLSFLTLCDLSFDCGCCAPGMGDWKHCDIQTAGAPDCPWCKKPAISALVFAIAALGALGAARVAAPRLPWWVIVAVSWAGFNLTTLLGGIVTALVLGRPVLAGL